MARSLKKGPYCNPKLLKKVIKEKAEKGTKGKIVIKTYDRGSTIFPEFVGVTVMIHNGKDFIPLIVSEGVVGHKFGEFAPTRTYKGHAADKKGK